MGEVETECNKALEEAIQKAAPDLKTLPEIRLQEPPSPEFGDLSTSVCLDLAEKLAKSKDERKGLSRNIAQSVADMMDLTKSPLLDRAEVAGNGYINFFFDYERLSEMVLKACRRLDSLYGHSDIGKGWKIMVEHTSANPVHPLHIGSARNAVLGDTLARLFKAKGHETVTHYYIDDMGRQTATLAYGFSKLDSKASSGKIDHWLGMVYAITNVILVTHDARQEMGQVREAIANMSEKFLEVLQSSVTHLGYVIPARARASKLEKTLYAYYHQITKQTKTVRLSASWISEATEIAKSLGRLERFVENAIAANRENSSIVNILGDLKRELKQLRKGTRDVKGLVNLLEEIMDAEEWLDAQRELKLSFSQLYGSLEKKILSDENPNLKIEELMAKYEQQDPHARKLFRDVCELCIDGFKETLSRAGISFDSFDWESELAWTGIVQRVLDELDKTGYLTKKWGSEALYVDLKKACGELEDIRGLFGITLEGIDEAKKEGKLDDYLPSDFVVRREDGTTLYSTRDIAYSLWKYEQVGVNEIYNVIGVAQNLAQKRVNAGLRLMGYSDYGRYLHHFGYELVNLEDMKMSGRMGRYIAFDKVMDEAVQRAYEEVNKRSPGIDDKVKVEISEKVGIGAVRYALLNVHPLKTILFTWDRVLDFEKNSAPFIQYAHARACSILRKAKKLPKEIFPETLRDELEKNLVKQLAYFPEVILQAVNDTRPDLLCGYANMLAQTLNSFYAKLPVLKAEAEELRDTRLALVDAVRITLRNALNLLGIVATERM